MWDDVGIIHHENEIVLALVIVPGEQEYVQSTRRVSRSYPLALVSLEQCSSGDGDLRGLWQ